MVKFKLGTYTRGINLLQRLEFAAQDLPDPLPPEQLQIWVNGITPILRELRKSCLEADLSSAIIQIDYMVESLPKSDGPSLRTLIRALNSGIEKELDTRLFLFIPPYDAVRFDEPALFGAAVWFAFPSAEGNIREAGSCYATGRYTATVFHAMCALEPALRALAKDAKVPFNRKRFDQQEWGRVLEQIELRTKPEPNKRITRRRREHLTFLSVAAKEFYYFKEAWRNHNMHGRAHYDGPQALSVLEHVRAFMEHLASRLSEPGAKRRDSPDASPNAES